MVSNQTAASDRQTASTCFMHLLPCPVVVEAVVEEPAEINLGNDTGNDTTCSFRGSDIRSIRSPADWASGSHLFAPASVVNHGQPWSTGGGPNGIFGQLQVDTR